MSPILFPPRDLSVNNQKTSNLVYQDDVPWSGWGSIKPGLLPTPKPDLCIAFDETAFTPSELEKMKSPYADGSSYAPALTIEFKSAMNSIGVANRQNANNMIPLLEADYALQKTNGTDKKMERRIRFLSAAHDTAMQRYDAWFYVLKNDNTPKWCSVPLISVSFDNPDDDGFQTARRCNLNYCEYISDSVFRELRAALAGAPPAPASLTDTPAPDVSAALVQAGHLETPPTSTEPATTNKRPRRSNE